MPLTVGSIRITLEIVILSLIQGNFSVFRVGMQYIADGKEAARLAAGAAPRGGSGGRVGRVGRQYIVTCPS